MNRKYILPILGLTLLAGFSSCKKQKEISPSKEISRINEQARFDAQLDNTLPFNTFQAKVNMTLDAGKKPVSVNGTIRIIRDERLQISVQPLLGIEVFRVELTNDSVRMLDRINKRYVAESIVAYREKLPVTVNFSTLQALFMNSMFMPGKENLVSSDFTGFSWRTESDGLLVARLKDQDLFNLNFFIDTDDRLSQTRVSDPRNTQSVTWSYSQFSPTGGVSFPKDSKLEYASSKNMIRAEFVYSKIEINKSLNMQFSVPSSYSRIGLEDLIMGLIK